MVDRISVLHPAMRGKWRFLDADDCLHGQTVFLTHGSERKGSLQAFVMASAQYVRNLERSDYLARICRSARGRASSRLAKTPHLSLQSPLFYAPRPHHHFN